MATKIIKTPFGDAEVEVMDANTEEVETPFGTLKLAPVITKEAPEGYKWINTPMGDLMVKVVSTPDSGNPDTEIISTPFGLVEVNKIATRPPDVAEVKKYCWNCGAIVKDNYKFCPACGARQ